MEKKKNKNKVVKKKETKNKEIKKEKIIKDKRNLVVAILYLICGLIWIVGGISKLLVDEDYVIDVIVGTALFGFAIFYFSRYKTEKK